jgi:molybdate transport system regulatory protein
MMGDKIAMGPGKAALLQAIDSQGSISAAARLMGMSYRRAWMLADMMNHCFRTPLIETQSGGGKGAGAQLTPQGHAILAAYQSFCCNIENAKSQEDYDVILQALRH